MKAIKLSMGLMCVLMLAACGKSLDGTYVMDGGFGGSTSLTFKSGGKVIQSSQVMGIGAELEMSYKIEDDKIKITSGQGGSMVLTFLPDGNIQGPAGMKYLKKK